MNILLKFAEAMSSYSSGNKYSFSNFSVLSAHLGSARVTKKAHKKFCPYET